MQNNSYLAEKFYIRILKHLTRPMSRELLALDNSRAVVWVAHSLSVVGSNRENSFSHHSAPAFNKLRMAHWRTCSLGTTQSVARCTTLGYSYPPGKANKYSSVPVVALRGQHSGAENDLLTQVLSFRSAKKN